MQELEHLLVQYIRRLGITVKFNLELKNYSKNFYGRYNPNKNSVIIYVFDTPSCTQTYTVWELLRTLIHELCHCEQWNSADFVRHKGVMHTNDFWKKYNSYVTKADSMLSNREKEVRYINVTIAV